MNKQRLGLTSAGVERREAILLLARSAAARRRRRRRLIQLAVPVVAMIGVTLVVMQVLRTTPGRRSPTIVATSPHPGRAGLTTSAPMVPAASAQTRPPVLVQYIATDPTLVRRLTLGPVRRQWTVIDDDHLLQALADAGQPAGIVRFNDRAVLLFR